MVAYLNRLLQLSHPPLLPHLTLTRAQEMAHTHCYLAEEYATELQAWASGELIVCLWREPSVNRILFAFNFVASILLSLLLDVILTHTLLLM